MGPLEQGMRLDELAEREGWSEELKAEVAACFDVAQGRLERYQDQAWLGDGGSAVVRRVLDLRVGRNLALKTLRYGLRKNAPVRQRFRTEIQTTAALQHPGVVPVMDWGENKRGQLWFTMEEVQGATLEAVIAELHEGADGNHWGGKRGFRRLVDAFARMAHVLGYAHRIARVVHGDLKPENLVLGAFGEVYVVDWGLARHLPPQNPERRTNNAERRTNNAGLDSQNPGPTTQDQQPRTNNPGPDSQNPGPTTQDAPSIIGTPAYMAPELFTGNCSPASDVYALGAVLYALLSGRPPFRGNDSDTLQRLRAGEAPEAVDTAAGKDHPELPADLVDICCQAMASAPAERYADAEEFALDLERWLDGARKQERAEAECSAARELEPQIRQLREQAEALRLQAREASDLLRPWEPTDKKQGVWRLEDEAAELERKQALAEATWLQHVHAARNIDPEHRGALDMLLGHYRAELEAAERRGDSAAAAGFEQLIRSNDRHRENRTYLRGMGRLELHIEPPEATVELSRFAAQGRRMQLRSLGPIEGGERIDIELERGSYLLLIRAPGSATTRYPVLIERGRRWRAEGPEQEAHVLRLPSAADLDDEDCYVPAGWFQAGGDPKAIFSGPSRQLWAAGFVLRRHPVTNAEYLLFLNDLLAQGLEADALDAAPRLRPSADQGGLESLVYERGPEGEFRLGTDSQGKAWQADWPVAQVTWFQARAYAAWRAERDALPWRLPAELEWEKAARGVDGRCLPWGNHFEPTWANVLDSHAGEPYLCGIAEHPLDESPYGLRGLGGNVRDWCGNVSGRVEVGLDGERVLTSNAPLDAPGYRASRGGAWNSSPPMCRSATRFGDLPDRRFGNLGFRLARSLDP